MAEKILITGATGFVGRALAKRMSQDGCDVVPFSRAGGNDLEHPDALASLRGRGVRTVFHCAGRSFVPASWEDPESFYRVNVLGTQHVLDYCRAEGASLVYVSTYVYGRPRYVPVDEEHPPQPLNPYTHSKFLAEELCRFYREHFGVQVTILRPFNLYGPGQSEHFLIAQLIHQWRSGSEIVVDDARPRRDHLYIDDFVEACAVIYRKTDRAAVYNLGSGVSVSIADVVAALSEVVSSKLSWRSRDKVRQGEILDVVASCRLVREGAWKPRTTLTEGLRQMIETQ